MVDDVVVPFQTFDINYENVPVNYMVDGLRMYLERGVEPGSFLSSVLKNDLEGACMFADENNKLNIFNWVQWLHCNLNHSMWGSPEIFYQWLQQGGLAGYYNHKKDSNNEEWHD